MTGKQPRSNRRSFAKGVLTVAGAGTIAGCTGDNDSSEGGSTGSNPVDEAPANDTVNPNNSGYDNSKPGNTSNGTAGNGTAGNGTDTGTENTPEELTGRQVYFDWIHGENEQILEENKGRHGEIKFQAVDNALENGFEDRGRNQAIAKALETASQQYYPDDSYEKRHRHILSALHTTLEQKEGDQWNFDVTSMTDKGKSPGFPRDGIDFSKVWVETEDGEYTNINAGLSDKYEHTTHIKGKETNNRIQEELQFLRDSEKIATRPAHDLETHLERFEYDRESLDREYSDEELEQGFGSWLELFSNYVLGEGNAVPSSKEDWKAFHRGIEKGPEIFLSLNEAYHNSGYDGETVRFSIEDKSVSVEEVPEGYTPAEDGIPGNPAA